MQVLKINRISELVSQLKENLMLKYTCGFKVIGRVPSESTFSRFINKIPDSLVLEALFSKLVLIDYSYNTLSLKMVKSVIISQS